MNEVETGTRWVLALDPGKVTGWAMYNTEDHPLQDLLYGEVEGRYGLADHVRRIIGSGAIIEVVCEDFVISERTIKTARDNNALRLIGWLDIQLDHLGVELSLQTAGQAKGFSTDEKLSAVGWLDTTPGGHSNDAKRHLLVYLLRRYPDHAAELLKEYR